ncbi:hypothetical protein BDZ91DRAFT_789049 [Kalaharituber pfeilii]|nr:hypothetical protein BDZ91DRAFT_789049 [Kalaharituber pfeilii]
MTTSAATPPKPTDSTFSYAAAASGKHSPTIPITALSSSSSMNNSGSNTPNGIPIDGTNAQASADAALPAEPKSKGPGVQSNPIVPNGPTTSESGPPLQGSIKRSEEKITSAEKDHTEESQSSFAKEEGKVAEVPKEKLVPAPPPTVNIWTLRAQEFEAKAKLQLPTVPAVAGAAASKPISKTVEKPAEARQGERKRGGNKMEGGTWDADKGRDSNTYDRKESTKDGRDRKKSTDSGRVNGYAQRDDSGSMRHNKGANRHLSKSIAEKEATVPEPPPPLGDATLWPTPEIAQDEEKKEKERLQREEKEKEKPTITRSSGPTKFVPAPFTPTIVHSAPLPTKSGRGGRGGRSGGLGRGGNTAASSGEGRHEKGDKSEKPVGGNSSTQTTDTDRGRVSGRGAGYTRGGHHGNTRGNRRTGSAGSNVPQKTISPVHQPRDKKEVDQSATVQSANGGIDNSANSAPSPSEAGVTRQETQKTTQGTDTDDGAFIGQGVIPPQYPERNDHVHNHSFDAANGQGSQRSDGPNVHLDAASMFPQSRSERVSASTRGGGYRGRGGHYVAQQQHHHHHHHHHHGPHASTHGNTIPNQPYQAHNAGQFPPQNQQYRGYSRGRSHSGPGRGYTQNYPNAVYHQQHQMQQSQQHQQQPQQAQYIAPGYAYYDYNSVAVIEDPLSHPQYSYHKEYFSDMLSQLTKQMEYYFSVDNLCKDIFLRKHMDSDGFVSLNLVAGFGIIRKITHNIEMLKDACQASPHIEVISTFEGYRVRKATGYESFVLRPEDRDPSVRPGASGSESGQSTGSSRPQMSGAAPAFQPALHQQSLNSVKSLVEALPMVPVYATSNVNGVYVQPPAFTEANGIQRSHSQLSADAAEFSPSTNGFVPVIPAPQADSVDFPDEKIGEVNIIYRKSFLENTTSPENPSAKPAVNAEVLSNGNNEAGTESCASSPRSGVLCQHGVSWTIGHSEESGTFKHVSEKYTALRTAALQKRLEGSPTSAKMTILYRFWNHFLMKNFNRQMYEEFKTLTLEDAQTTSGKSLEFLFGYYEAVHNHGSPHEDVSRDFVELAQKLKDDGWATGKTHLDATIESAQVNPTTKTVLEKLRNLRSDRSS